MKDHLLLKFVNTSTELESVSNVSKVNNFLFIQIFF